MSRRPLRVMISVQGCWKVSEDMLNRRSLLAGGMAAGVCTSFPARAQELVAYQRPEDFLPAIVRLDADFPPGEIHVIPDQFRLYWTLVKQEALRFTVGIGRPGLYHAGRFTVGAKREWPSWRPTSEMIARDPERYGRYADGMPGGPDNPLGARALYLYDEAGQDTYLRIHGTNDPQTIGSAVSNGCARLTNEDITFWYTAVGIDSPVFLHPQGATGSANQLGSSDLSAVDEVSRIPREVVPEPSPLPVSALPPRGR